MMILRGCFLAAIVSLYILDAIITGKRPQEMRGLIYFLAFDTTGTASLFHNGEDSMMTSFLWATSATAITAWVLWALRQPRVQRQQIAEVTKT